MAVHVSCSSLCLFHLCVHGFCMAYSIKQVCMKAVKALWTRKVSLRDARWLKISSMGIKWCFYLLFYSWPSVIFPLLTGHMQVFILTADEVRPFHSCDNKAGAAGGRMWCPLLELIKSWKGGPSFISYQQTLVEHELAFLPLGLVFNSIF